MTSYQIREELRAALERKNITQVQLARKTYRAVTTVNGYFRNDPMPIEAAKTIAMELDDSILSMHISSKAFSMMPPMESDLYLINIETLEVIHETESTNVFELKRKAKSSLSKLKEHRNEKDEECILDYAMKVLDGIFIETRYLITLLEQIDMSLMRAVTKRKPYWKMKNYMKK